MTNASRTASPPSLSWADGIPTHAPAILLGFAFILQGAKTEIAFALWGLVALAYCAWRILENNRRLSWQTIGGALVVLLGLAFSQFFSIDKTASFFWTVQWATLTLLWIILRTEGVRFSRTSLLIIFRVAGVLTAFLTIQQIFHHSMAWGWLPVNTDWNAAWMAVTAIYLVSSAMDCPASPFCNYADFFLAALLVGLIAMSISRNAVLGLLVGMAVFVHARFRIGWGALALVAGLGTLGLLPTAWFQSRLASTLLEIHQGGRIEIWRTALQSLVDHPLLGYGAGNFELAYLRHAFPVVRNPVYYDLTTAFAHNDYLQPLIELGWPVGGWLLFGVAALFKPREGLESFEFLPEKASITALMVMAFFNPTFHLPLMLLTALLFAAVLFPKAQTRDIPTPQTFWLKAGLLGLVFLTAAGLFWRGLRASWAQQQRWDRIVAICPADAQAWHELGNRQDSTEAVQAQTMAVEQSPDQPYYHEALARALESTGRTEETAAALQAYLEATLEAPKRATNFLAIGRLLFKEGDPVEALPWFEKALALEPFYWEANLWMARCYFARGKTGDRERAVAILDSLQHRQSVFWNYFPTSTTQLSPYGQTILGYDSSVVDRQRQWFLDKMRHS